ncbi:YkuS family protein [Eubacteriales bacterium mix99]|jgi:hypothetical protein|nr:hypothetical protein [Clostridiales bacterium]
MQTIVLERGMEELKTILEQHGYHTIYEDEESDTATCYIYREQNPLSQKTFPSFRNMEELSASSASNILMIPAENKTPEEIITMIENRVYSPLFPPGYF